ncbi:sigma factor-like helix-turn-helix DNA-binding protein [Pseudomonas sp. PIC25]
MTGHYYQQLSFVQISELMRVSKARVSQLHGQGLRRLRLFTSAY